jgi:8-oxo-dGTP pyrophosphatase MutT (NUDIX family)
MRQCSGTVPYRFIDGQIKVCVVRSSDGERWVFPKGGVEPHLGRKSNAVKETWEEAGLIGHITKGLGCIETGINRTKYFMMRVVVEAGHYPEQHRTRRWAEVNDAREWLDPSLHFLLDALLDELA